MLLAITNSKDNVCTDNVYELSTFRNVVFLVMAIFSLKMPNFFSFLPNIVFCDYPFRKVV